MKEISTQPGNKHFAAVGLDRFSNNQSSPVRHQQLSTYRFLRVWEHGRGGKLAKHKIYLKSRLNCVLLTRYVKVSRSVNNGETNAKKLITRPIMTVTSPNSPHITFTDTKFRFDHFFDQTYPPSWSKCVLCIESGVVFLSGQKSIQNSRISTAKFY